MSENTLHLRSHQQWARLRFSVVGPLLACPPQRGQLQTRLRELAAQKWRHPTTAQWVQFGLSTIERWYYTARQEKQDPVQALERKLRSDLGQHPSLSLPLRAALALQYRQHPNWSYQLHTDNLAVLAGQKPELGPAPAYASVLRFMKAQGWFKRPRRGPVHSPGAQLAEHRFENREVRSYESEYVNALWHLDFHHGSVRVLLDNGQWAYPLLLGVLDDHSRLCCHAQWYLSEGAEELCHGLSQALQKRGLPRALMSDNGSAMLAAETVQGLARLGIVHETTLPFSPYQNGKQEVFWGQIEGRLLPMLEGVVDLTLARLNEATLAWVEMEYNRKPHSELGASPLQCYLHHKDVGRPCPASEALRLAFTAELGRTLRRSDGTVSLGGVRFELPSRYGHFERITLRAASWDLSHVYLSDPKTGTILSRIFPLDKNKNAQGQRAAKVGPLAKPNPPAPPPATPAPLLQKLIKDYAATGLPPAYLPKDEITPTHNANPS
jgi:transposase InsO family protein